jgi:hypothetical protein
MIVWSDELFSKNDHSQKWAQILGRISPCNPTDVDDLTRSLDTVGVGREPGQLIELEDMHEVPSFQLSDERLPLIAVSFDEYFIQDLPRLASKLAGMAIEDICDVIILSTQSYCPLEHFGFRVIRIGNKKTASTCNYARQVCDAYGVDLVI